MRVGTRCEGIQVVGMMGIRQWKEIKVSKRLIVAVHCRATMQPKRERNRRSHPHQVEEDSLSPSGGGLTLIKWRRTHPTQVEEDSLSLPGKITA